MSDDSGSGPIVPKFRFNERKLVKLLSYIETDPSAHSRQNSIYHMEKVGYRRLPLKNDDERKFYLRAGYERGLINDRGAIVLAGDLPNTGAYVGVELSQAGYDFLENARAGGFWVSNFRQLQSNVVTIIISVVTAVLASWATYYVGAPKDTQSGNHVEAAR